MLAAGRRPEEAAYLLGIAARTIDFQLAHAKLRMDMGPRLYELWLAALRKTVAANDPQFGSEVASAWKPVFDHGIAAMQSRHGG